MKRLIVVLIMKIGTTLKIGILISLMAYFLACKSESKFDSTEWNKKGVDWQLAELRENMISNLIESNTLIGLEKNIVIELLGKPEIEKDKKFKYLVREKILIQNTSSTFG
tara:strand:- start:7827 stop:8156 length:330 start_codon:yes stop_codon:yes gene_type:complete